ncbi:MAG: ATP-binding protein [Steroidobacteraceae bacterium]
MASTPQSDANTDYKAQLEQAQRELQSLTYAISHDLRAPVRAITGFSQALKEEAGETLNPSCQHYLQRIEQATQRLSQMIEGLLKLSRLAQADLLPVQVDVGELCSGIAEELQRQYPDHHPQLVVAPSIHAWADPILLRTALRELLQNAWKFTQGRSDARIRVSADISSTDCITLGVHDNGIGFDMQYVDRLFVPFQHLQTKAELNGIGIGLACVQRIVSRHAGKVWVEAAPQQGAAFYMSLPRAQ